MGKSEKIKNLYSAKYGEDLTWENLQEFIPTLIDSSCAFQRKIVAEMYTEKTTMISGKFVGDKRIVDLIIDAPTPNSF